MVIPSLVNPKQANFWDEDFYRRFDIIAIINDFAAAHRDSARIQNKAAKAVTAIKNDRYYQLSTTANPRFTDSPINQT